MKPAVQVLVVDDNSSICQLVGAILKGEQAEVCLAATAHEAVDRVETQSFDVLFVDLRLPDGDGIEVIQRCQSIRPQIASVVFTGAATFDSAVDAIRLGACDYVTKPIDREKIVSAYRRALRFKNATDATEGPAAANGQRRDAQIVAVSPEMRKVGATVARVASGAFPVLIQGEVGVGKKLLARMMHQHGRGMAAPFVHIPCAMLQEFSGQSPQVFGSQSQASWLHEWDRLLCQPNGGTLFLEDVGQLPLWAQVKLLDTIDDGWLPDDELADRPPKTVRVVASTADDLQDAVAAGRFHRALFDHLNLFPIRIPALRERPQDIRALVNHFFQRFVRTGRGQNGRQTLNLPDDVWELIGRYSWPGNVRELANVCTRAMLLEADVNLAVSLRQYLRSAMSASPPDTGETISIPLVGDMKEIERSVIREVVRRHDGNKAAAARSLGMHRRTLYRILENRRSGAQNTTPRPEPVS